MCYSLDGLRTMKKLLVLALVLGLAGCSSSTSSTAYTIGTAIVSWDTADSAVYWVITQTPGDQGSATVSIGVGNNSPVLFYLTPGTTYTFSVSSYLSPPPLPPAFATATALPSPITVATGQNYDLFATF
jgi:hypothetical protein